MRYSIPITCTELVEPEPPGLTTRDFGVRLARELVSDLAATWSSVCANLEHGPVDATEVMLNSLPPERAAAKRQAIAQRIARESR